MPDTSWWQSHYHDYNGGMTNPIGTQLGPSPAGRGAKRTFSEITPTATETSTHSDQVSKRATRRPSGGRRNAYTSDEMHSILPSIWSGLSARDAHSIHDGDFNRSNRALNAFSTKYSQVQTDLLKILAAKPAEKSELVISAPNIAYEYLKPSFVTLTGKYYWVVSKQHYFNITVAINGVFL